MLKDIGIWNNDYVVKLSIMDHLDELKILDTRIKEVKNSDPVDSSSTEDQRGWLEDHFEQELADLWLLLSTHFDITVDNLPDIIKKRKNKFLQKSGLI
jgi:hypothetical protein